MTQECLPFTVDEIPDPGSRSFTIVTNASRVEAFVVRKGNQIYAYHNSCPHTGVALNWSEDIFLSHDEGFIQCAMHGAQFSIAEGYCVWGPCVGKSLQKLALVTDADGSICIEI